MGYIGLKLSDILGKTYRIYWANIIGYIRQKYGIYWEKPKRLIGKNHGIYW